MKTYEHIHLFNTKLLKMKFILLLLLSYATAISRDLVNASTLKEDGIYILDDENFNDFVNYNDIVLVSFYEEADMKVILVSLLQ